MNDLHPGWPAVLSAGPVTVRPPNRADARPWSRVRLANASWLSQWEPSSSQNWSVRNTPQEFRRTLGRMRAAARIGSMLPFIVVYGDQLVGQMSASNVIRGALRSCSIGYWVDSRVAGRGIAPTALALVIDHCLTGVRLHRVEVNIRPENHASIRVVEKLGLRREGYHERFLDIDGAWRDHLTFAITSEEVLDAPVLSRLATLPVPPG
ncbi:MAG: GNAT family N-acetyltransferase [Actinomycetota bacterium]|nr:GNAT family N-acetyltransferase [Actinomycetota bacterium]MDQ2848065.1 GNAT family N-acetyltransferase [Actinomycetota bacterium]MDQ2958814.1 GNAT family N-acetyltransferase [Actinomycetota bacterium]